MENKENKENNKKLIIKFLDWLIYIIGYTLIFILSSYLFENFYIDLSYFGIYAIVAVIILYFLNKTVKPIIFKLTIPITGLTLGLFYLFINFFVLKLTDWILMSHFELGNSIYAFFIAIFISVTNIIMENVIIKPIIRRLRHNG